MEPNEDRADAIDHEVDARLAARPLRPASDFVNRVFAGIEAEALAPQYDLDLALAAKPLGASPEFADRVLAEVAAARRRRRWGLWAAPLAVAASLALAVVAFRAPADSVDVRLARLLSEDAELKALTAAAPVVHESQFETDLAALAELGAAELINEPKESAS